MLLAGHRNGWVDNQGALADASLIDNWRRRSVNGFEYYRFHCWRAHLIVISTTTSAIIIH